MLLFSRSEDPMHIAAQLDAALEQARQQGFRLRSEWLGGSGGGMCEIRGDRWLFIDLTLEPREQLEMVRAALSVGLPRASREAAECRGRRAG